MHTSWSIVIFVSSWCAHGCSYVEIPVQETTASNGTRYVIARTNELGNILGRTKYRIAAHARGERDSRFGYITLEGQVNGSGNIWVAADGMNEAGFTLGAQTLRESEYESLAPSQLNDTLALDLVHALLRECANVDEALDWLAKHRVVGPSGAVGLHWAMADDSGRSVVVEYLRGQRTVWENGPRVMTNDPALDWHWRNLNNYAYLGGMSAHQNNFMQVDTAEGRVPKVVGHGGNLLGMPGDGSPASRYVQLFYLRGYAVHAAPPKTIEDAIVLGSGLLNKVFIPLGTFQTDDSLADRFEGTEYTPFAVIKIPSERKMAVRGYRNLRWRQVDLAKLKFEKNTVWPVEDGTLGIDDITFDGLEAQSEFSV